MAQTMRNRALQFSLAWLVFWTFVCAVAAGIARSFLAGGQEGLAYLLCFAALGIWLLATFVVIYLTIFLQRRWNQSAAMRDELEGLVKQRRAEREQASDAAAASATSSPATSSLGPGP
jgi:hypothetical protein